jgi:hypothetical protein
MVEAEFTVPLLVKLAPLGFSCLAGLVYLIGVGPGFSREWVIFFSKRWGWDLIDASLARRTLLKGYTIYTNLERGFFEVVGPSGVGYLIGRIYDVVRNRGWFSFFWVAGMIGFVGLALLSGGDILYYPVLPFYPPLGPTLRTSWSKYTGYAT